MVIARPACVALTLMLFAGLPVTAQTPEEAFGAGNKAYEDGDFAAAAEAYRGVLRYAIVDPRLEYNLGNAEFKLGNLGRSILHYERARRLDPTDEDTLANLTYARGFTVDQVPAENESALVNTVRSLQDRLGVDRQAWLGLTLLWLICGILAWGLSRPGRFTPALGWSLATLILISGIVGTSWYSTHERLVDRRLAVVLSDVVEVLAGPGVNNATLFTVHEGLTVEVRQVGDEWVQVSLPNLTGWVPRDAVELV